MDERLPDDYLESLVGKKVVLRIVNGLRDQECGLLLAFVTDHVHPKKGFQYGHLVLWDRSRGGLYTVATNKALYVAPATENEVAAATMSYSLRGEGRVIVMLPALVDKEVKGELDAQVATITGE